MTVWICTYVQNTQPQYVHGHLSTVRIPMATAIEEQLTKLDKLFH